MLIKSEKITLYFKEGTSDKVYHASIEEAEGKGFVVNFAYGRRGATLKTGTKTTTPADYASAKKIYDALVRSKTAKGYALGLDGGQYVHTDTEARDTGVRCQLLNFIEKSEVTRLINDDDWWAQEKFNGKRMLIRKAETVTAITRQGLSVGAPEDILKSSGKVRQTYLADGEAVGEKLVVFDLLEIGDTDMRQIPYSLRLSHLESLGLKGSIKLAETARTKKEKQQLYDRLIASGAEGIVFEKHSAPYTAGRPNSGGNQEKCEFYETASVIVTRINAKRSVAIAVMSGKTQVGVGWGM